MTAISAAWHRHGRGAVRVVAVAMVIAVTAVIAVRVAHDWSSIDRTALRDQLHLDPVPLVAAYGIQSVGWLLMILVWRRILRHMGADAPLTTHLVAISYSGLTHVLPGSVWTPVSRVALYRSRGVAVLPVGAALVVEWLLVGLGGLALYGLSAPWSHAQILAAAWPLALVAGSSVAVLHPAASNRMLRWGYRRSGRDEAAAIAPPPGVLAAWFVTELLVLALSGAALYAVMVAVSPAASLPDAMAAWGMSMAVANLLVWLPATSLLKEVGMVVLLTPLYGSAALALAVTIVWRVWMLGVMLSWAAMAAIADRHPSRARPSTSE